MDVVLYFVFLPCLGQTLQIELLRTVREPLERPLKSLLHCQIVGHQIGALLLVVVSDTSLGSLAKCTECDMFKWNKDGYGNIKDRRPEHVDWLAGICTIHSNRYCITPPSYRPSLFSSTFFPSPSSFGRFLSQNPYLSTTTILTITPLLAS